MTHPSAGAPTVSVIMPTFNRLQFLPAAVASLFAQTFRDWELIIADDGSEAATRHYLRTLQGRAFVEVVWLSHSGRPASARNAALRVARGEYVAFLDSDDLWLPAKLALQLESLRRHPQRHWSYTSFGVVDSLGRPQRRQAPGNRATLSGWILEALLSERIVIALPSVVVRRELLTRCGAFDERLIQCEDDELWLRLATHSEIDALEEPLTLIRRHGQHCGDDVTAWRDRRTVFERALQRNPQPQIRKLLLALRAQTSAGLARSQGASAQRGGALLTLAASAPYGWRHARWWHGALRTLASVLLPRALRRRLARARVTRRAPLREQA